MYTIEHLITEVRDHFIVDIFRGGNHPEFLAEKVCAKLGLYERDSDTGEMFVPNWVSNLALQVANETPNYRNGTRVALIGPEFSEERYHEGEAVLPAGAVGTVFDVEPQGGIAAYFVDFGTVHLLVEAHNLTRA